MAQAVRIAAVLTGALMFHAAAQGPPPPYNVRSTYFMDANCMHPQLIQEYYFPKLNQCVRAPPYPPSEAGFWSNGMALSVLSCNSTAAVVNICNETCGSCMSQTVPQGMCTPSDDGTSQLVNFTCTMDPKFPPASTGRPAEPCFGAQMDAAQKCKNTDLVDICDPMSPCNQSRTAMFAACPGSRVIVHNGENMTVAAAKMQGQMLCTPCALASSRVLFSPYCGIAAGGNCYADCVQNMNMTLQQCSNGNLPPWAPTEESFIGVRMTFEAIVTKCANMTMPPPPPSRTEMVTVTYFKGGADSTCGANDAWPNATNKTISYGIWHDYCVPGLWTPKMPAGSYQLRFDACNGQRIVAAACDAACVCGPPMTLGLGDCVDMDGYKQKVTWDRCPVPMPPPTTTTPPPPPPGPPPPPPVTVSGSMTVKAASKEAAAAIVADPQVKMAFTTAIATIAGVDPSIVNVSLSVGGRRLEAAAVAPRRLDGGSVVVSYVIALPPDGGVGPGGAPLPSPDAVKDMLTAATPAQVQASVAAAYAAMGATPAVAFTVDTVTAPVVTVPTTTTTAKIGTASGAEGGAARPWLAAAGLLLAVPAWRCAP